MPDQLEIALKLRDAMTAENFAELISEESALELFEASIGPFCHEDFETAMVSGGSGLRNEYRGAHGFVSAWRDWVTPFESFRIAIDDEMAGTDVLVGLAHQTGVLAGGGEVTSDAAAVMFFREGLLARVEFHMDRAEALRVAGL